MRDSELQQNNENLGLFFFAVPPQTGQYTRLQESDQEFVITAVNHCWMTIDLAPATVTDEVFVD
jgi:hypothetical protein